MQDYAIVFPGQNLLAIRYKPRENHQAKMYLSLEYGIHFVTSQKRKSVAQFDWNEIEILLQQD